MRIDIITLFPNMFSGPFAESIIARAVKKGLVEINCYNLRDFALDKHKTVDDTPYGGGAGMVLKVDVLDTALAAIKSKGSGVPRVILLTPQGQKYTQSKAKELVKADWLILICGHYEGFDERIRSLVNEEISIGDYVLTGGEIPAMALVDSVIRLLPGALGKKTSYQDESFEQGLLEYPQYTRPEKFKGMPVPEILKSGNHLEIERWRRGQAKERTGKRRPDLLTG